MTCLIIVTEVMIGVVESMEPMFMSVKNLGWPFNGDHKEGYVVFTPHGVVVFACFQFLAHVLCALPKYQCVGLLEVFFEFSLVLEIVYLIIYPDKLLFSG